MAEDRSSLAHRLLIERPDRTALAILAFHLVAWSFVPWMVNDALPLDTIEALAWGREWALGYDKHPPLSAWAAEIFGRVFLRSDLGLYALSALCTAGGLAIVWRLSRELLSPTRALLALILLEGVYYHGFTAPEFNVNVLQIPLWAGAMYAYWRGLHGGGLGWWAALGSCAGLALLSKYLAGALLIGFAVHALVARRDLFRRVGPYFAGAICLALFAPHAAWAFEHDWITLRYGVERAGGEADAGFVDHVLYPASFLLAQLGAIGGLLWLLIVWVPARRALSETEREARRFLIIMAVAPMGSLVGLSVLTGFELRSMWATPMLLASGPAAMAFLRTRFPESKPRDGLVWCGVILAAPVAIYAGISLLTLEFREKPKRVNYPGEALGAAAQAAWEERLDGPLRVVIGSEWEGGLVGWYAADRPSVYIGASPARAQWMSDERVRERGAIVVWTKAIDAEAPEIEHAPMPFGVDAERFAGLTPLPDAVLAYPSAPDKAARFGLAIIPPGGALGND
jgi:4-amino-4-deoxy-L-arabinose transferase-like glycosyltransferase